MKRQVRGTRFAEIPLGEAHRQAESPPAGDGAQEAAVTPLQDTQMSCDLPRREPIAFNGARGGAAPRNGMSIQIVETAAEKRKSTRDADRPDSESETGGSLTTEPPIAAAHNPHTTPRPLVSDDKGDAGGFGLGTGRLIGQILIAAQRLDPENVRGVLEIAERNKLRFGDAAIRMGLLRVDDIDYALAQQFAYPYVARDDVSLSKRLLAVFKPDHPTVKQLRALRGQITLRHNTGRPFVAIVSPNRGDGRSFVAANLAVVFAQLGKRTLLVDACLRNPAQHEYFKLDLRTGLSTAIARSDQSAARPIQALPGLQVMPAGPLAPNSLELIEHARFNELLERAALEFEMVIIDTPAGIEGPEAPLLANRAGAAVMVARARVTREIEARRFATALEHARTRVLGLVFNGQ